MSAVQQALAGGSGFVPTLISGLLLWLKANSLSLNDGDAVGTWTDSGPTGNNATQSTSGSKPIFKTNIVNGWPIVRFDGIDDSMALTTAFSGNTFTVFVVVKNVDSTNGSVVLGTSGSTVSDYLFSGTSSAVLSLTNNPGDGFHATKSLTDGIFNVIEGRHDGTTATCYVNGSAGTGLTNSAGWLVDSLAYYSASAFSLAGDMAEVIYYNSALSTSNRQRVERYLGSKYGITVP